MDLEAEYNRLEKRLLQIERKIDHLEEEGLYGSVEYDDLMREMGDIELEMAGIEEEMERD